MHTKMSNYGRPARFFPYKNIINGSPRSGECLLRENGCCCDSWPACVDWFCSFTYLFINLVEWTIIETKFYMFSSQSFIKIIPTYIAYWCNNIFFLFHVFSEFVQQLCSTFISMYRFESCSGYFIKKVSFGKLAVLAQWPDMEIKVGIPFRRKQKLPKISNLK